MSAEAEKEFFLTRKYIPDSKPIKDNESTYICHVKCLMSDMGKDGILKIYKDRDITTVYKKLAMLNYSKWPEIYEVKCFDKDTYVVEEALIGQNLYQRMLDHRKKGIRFDESSTAKLILEICDALNVLHNMKPPIIHRDIKPSNIFITGDNKIKLIDFDISREYDNDKNQDTCYMGTRQYASPEHLGFAQFGQTDNRSDIYSLGIVMYEMLTGELPNEKFNGFQSQLKPIIEKCIAIHPKDRFQTIAELKNALLGNEVHTAINTAGEPNLINELEQYNLPCTVYINNKKKKSNKMISGAISSYAKLGQNENAILCYDGTVLGNGKEGFLLSDKRLYMKDFFKGEVSLDIKQIVDFELRVPHAGAFHVMVHNANGMVHDMMMTTSKQLAVNTIVCIKYILEFLDKNLTYKLQNDDLKITYAKHLRKKADYVLPTWANLFIISLISGIGFGCSYALFELGELYENEIAEWIGIALVLASCIFMVRALLYRRKILKNFEIKNKLKKKVINFLLSYFFLSCIAELSYLFILYVV